MSDIAEVIAWIESELSAQRARRSPRRYFQAVYLRTTQAVAASLDGCLDPAWVDRWTVAFAGLYQEALPLGEFAPAPWACAFTAADDLPPQTHVLLGMNAHINYDLPQALLAVITDAEFASGADGAVLACREADHRHIDELLATLAPDQAAADVIIAARTTAWRNAAVLARARQAGTPAFRVALAELAKLASDRAAALVRSGRAMPELTVSELLLPERRIVT